MAIKSFMGRRIKPEKCLPTNIKVSDYMTTKLVTFRPEQSLLEVMDTLIKHKISGGPVINEKNELLGIVSEGDCIKQISECRYYNMPMSDMTVEKHMVTDVETIDANMNIFDAANKFVSSKRRRFPIVENGKLTGQISQKDVLSAALTLNGQTWK